MVLARQGENKTLEDFRKIYDYCTEDFKTKNKKYTYTFGCLTDDPLSEMIATKKIFGKTDGQVILFCLILILKVGWLTHKIIKKRFFLYF